MSSNENPVFSDSSIKGPPVTVVRYRTWNELEFEYQTYLFTETTADDKERKSNEDYWKGFHNPPFLYIEQVVSR